MRWFDFLRRRTRPTQADEPRPDEDEPSEPETSGHPLDDEAEREFAHTGTVDLAADGVLDGDLDP